MLLTGIATVAYQILTHKVSAYMIIADGIGLLILFLISTYTLKLWYKMQDLNVIAGFGIIISAVFVVWFFGKLSNIKTS